jgi:hypothetical protein
MTSDLFGKWRKAAADLTDDILQQVSGYGNDVASKKEDALGPRKRAMGRVAGLNEAINMAKAAPEKGGLWDLGRKLELAKKELMALGRDQMLSQVPSLEAEAHDFVREAEDALRSGQREVKTALRKLGVASDLSVTGSLDMPLPSRRQATGGHAEQPAPFPTRPVMGPLHRMGSEVTDLIRCLAGAQANDSGWPVFNGKYVEYPRFRKEWWAYRQTYHGHVKDELACRSLKEKSLVSSVHPDQRHRRPARGLGHTGYMLWRPRKVHIGGPGAHHQVQGLQGIWQRSREGILLLVEISHDGS